MITQINAKNVLDMKTAIPNISLRKNKIWIN